MKKLIIATSVALAFSMGVNTDAIAGPKEASHTEEKKNEAIGFGAGALTGAALGGPVGAMVGGLIGLFIADDVNDENAKEHQAELLALQTIELEEKQGQIAMMRQSIEDITQQQMTQLVKFEQSQEELLLSSLPRLETSVQFKTGSSKVDESYQTQLNSIAQLLVDFPQLSVKITGFADQRGSAERNIQLSEQRASAVKEYLLSQNVKPSQVHHSGTGEVFARDLSKESHEKLFFDRKASIKILPSSAIMTAAN